MIKVRHNYEVHNLQINTVQMNLIMLMVTRINEAQIQIHFSIAIHTIVKDEEKPGTSKSSYKFVRYSLAF